MSCGLPASGQARLRVSQAHGRRRELHAGVRERAIIWSGVLEDRLHQKGRVLRGGRCLQSLEFAMNYGEKHVLNEQDANRFFSWMIDSLGGGCMSSRVDYVGATYTCWGLDDGILVTSDGSTTLGVPPSLFTSRDVT
jgi:hypothetical protein